MTSLNTLALQYITDIERLYYPSILASRDELQYKSNYSDCCKETLAIIKSRFDSKESFNDWWEENMSWRLEEIYKRNLNWYTNYRTSEDKAKKGLL